MNLLGLGQRLWTPRRGFTGAGQLQLNKSHFAYPDLIAAIAPTNGNWQPPIFVGPQATSAFPTSFTRGNLAPTAGEYGPALNFGAASPSDLTTGNQAVFGGTVNYSMVCGFRSAPTGGNLGLDDVIKKDLEWNPLQYATATTMRTTTWPGQIISAYPLAFATGDIIHCGQSVAGTAMKLYQSVNRGAISTSSFTITTTIPTGVTSTPLALGGNGAGSENAICHIYFAYFFKSALTADQIAQLFLDPVALFVPAEPELSVMYAIPPVPWPPAGPYGTPNLVQSTLRF